MADQSTSDVYTILETIRDHIIESGTVVPDAKIYISRPTHTFVGEGPIILIYTESPNRERRTGDENYWDTTYCWEFVNVDVIVDDIYNDVRNSSAIRNQLEIKSELETYLYGDRVAISQKLLDKGISLFGYRPNNAEDYRIEAQNGVMVGTSVPLALRREEQWRRKAKELHTVRHEGNLHTEESTRDFVIEETK